MDLVTAYIIISAINFIALLGMIGAYICRFWVFPDAFFRIEKDYRRWTIFSYSLSFILILTTLGIFITRSRIMAADMQIDLSTLMTLVMWRTHFGSHIVIALASLVVIWLINLINAFMLPKRVNFGHILIVICLLIIALMNTHISHAADQGDYTFKVFVDWLHLLSAAGWGGGVLTTVFCLYPFSIWLANKPDLFADTITRLSFICALSVLIVSLTGVYNSWWLLNGSFTALWQTATGWVLMAKLALVAIMLIIGFINRSLLTPRIKSFVASGVKNYALEAIKVTLFVDVFLITLILILAAMLIHSMPVMNMPMNMTMPMNMPM